MKIKIYARSLAWGDWSWWSIQAESNSFQASITWPSFQRQKTMAPAVKLWPVGGRPMPSPVCVPERVKRTGAAVALGDASVADLDFDIGEGGDVKRAAKIEELI